MDQMTAALGEAGQLTVLLCQPAELQAGVQIPPQVGGKGLYQTQLSVAFLFWKSGGPQPLVNWAQQLCQGSKLTKAGLAHPISGGAQCPDQIRMGVEPIHIPVCYSIGMAARTRLGRSAAPVKGIGRRAGMRTRIFLVKTCLLL
jgi:hypothetical protein